MRWGRRRPKPLGRREREVLCTIESLHREYDQQPTDGEVGQPARFTAAAIAHVAGPAAGSIGTLVALGLVSRANDEVTEQGRTRMVPVFALTDDGRRAASLVREQQRRGRITVPDHPTTSAEKADERSSDDGGD